MASEEKKYLGQPGAERLIANLREEIKACKTEQDEALAEHKEDSSVHVTAEEKEVLLGAVDHVHEHNNKEVLDNIASTVDIYTQADEPAEPAEDSIWVKDGVNGLPPSILIRKNGVWVMVSDGEAQKQADWNETDGTSASYIRNKPFGYFDDLYSNSSLQFDIDGGQNNVYSAPISSELFSGINEGDNVTVIWDSTTYNLVAYYSRITDFLTVNNVLGNARIASEFLGTTDGKSTGEPFCILPGIGTVYTRSTMASHSVIIKYKDKVVKIDPKYLPDDAFDTNGAAAEALEDSKAYTDEKIAGLVLENAQVDWNQEDESKPGFIHNKPEIPSVEGLATEDYVDEKIAAIGSTGGGHEHANKDVLDQVNSFVDIYTSEEDAVDAPDGSLLIELDAGGVGGGVAAGMGLPSVGADDNGKILQVVDGIWQLVDISESSVKTYVDEYIGSALEGEY